MNRWKRWLFIIIVTAAAVCLLILAGLAFFNIFEGSKAVMPIHFADGIRKERKIPLFF